MNHVGDLAHDLEKVGLASLLEHLLQFVAHVEVIFDGLLAAAGHHDDLIASRRQRLFHAVLDDGLIDQRKHLFRLGFSGGEETGAESGCGKDGFAHSHHASSEVLTCSLRDSIC